MSYMTIEQLLLLTSELNSGLEEIPLNFIQCRKKLYIQLLLVEKYLAQKKLSEAQNRISHCYDLFKTLKTLGSEYEISKESSYDLLKIVQLENRVKDVECRREVKADTKTHLLEAITNGDDDLRRGIILFEIKNLLKTHDDEPLNHKTIMSLFDMLPPGDSRDMVQIELFVKDIHNNLPELVSLTLSGVVTVISISREAGAQRRGECLQLVQDTVWTMSDVEKEECLASMLMASGTDLLILSRLNMFYFKICCKGFHFIDDLFTSILSWSWRTSPPAGTTWTWCSTSETGSWPRHKTRGRARASPAASLSWHLFRTKRRCSLTLQRPC